MRSRPVCFALAMAVGITVLAAGAARAAKPGDWPQWRGPARTGLSAEIGLLRSWPEDGPRLVWQIDNLGEAYSSIAVADGRIYTMGNVDDEGRIHCLDEQTGETIWSVHPPAETRTYTHGRGNGARGTPTIDGDRVYALGGGGDLTCLDARTGEVIWSLHLVKDLGGRVPGWGYSESPLVDGDHLIVTPGGDQGCLAALDKRTGKVVWRSKDVTDRAHYSSAIVANVDGVRQIIQFTGGGGRRRDPGASPPRVVGVDAETGRLLWDYTNSANRTANVATPIYQDGYVFTSSAYGTGGGLVRLKRDGEKFTAEEVYFEKSMANHHGGIVLVDGYLYGFGSGGLICMNFKTGEIAWRARSVRKGSLCYADGHLYCLGERNEMALVEANPREYVEKGRFPTPQTDRPSWAHPVVANGRLYIRDQNLLLCYDISAAE